MDYPGFCGPSNPSQAYTADQERCVNFYFEQQQYGSTSRYALYPTPGVDPLLEGSQVTAFGIGGGGRAHIFVAGREFAIIGDAFCEFNATNLVSIRGRVVDDGLPATISYGGDGSGQLLITSGNNAFVFTLSTNVLAIISALNGKARMGAVLDGFGIVLDTTNSTMYISALLDLATWSTGTDFAQRSI